MNPMIPFASRILLGLIYVVFGLSGVLNFLPAPVLPEAAVAFFVAMVNTGYFVPVLIATEVIFGLLLLAGRAAPLALVVLAPVTLQIVLFHAFLTPGLENQVIPVVMVILHLLAANAYWKTYRPLFLTDKGKGRLA